MTAEHDPPPARALISEHRALLALEAALRRHVSAVPQGREARWRSDLVVRLAELRLRVEPHFAAEEHSGLFERLGDSDEPGARRLHTEHARLRAGLARVCGLAEAADVSDYVLADHVRELLDALVAHEAAENEALTRHLDGSLAAAD